MQDVVVTDTLPSQVVVKHVGQGGFADGRIVKWTHVTLNQGESKKFTILVQVKPSTPNNTNLHNLVTAKSEDHNVSDEATDDTLVKVPKVAGIIVTPTPQPVPVSAKTGMDAMAALSLPVLMGGSGLAYTIKKAVLG